MILVFSFLFILKQQNPNTMGTMRPSKYLYPEHLQIHNNYNLSKSLYITINVIIESNKRAKKHISTSPPFFPKIVQVCFIIQGHEVL